MVMSEIQVWRTLTFEKFSFWRWRGLHGKECGWSPGAAHGPQLSDGKDVAASALQLTGDEFCQQHDEPGEFFTSTSRREFNSVDIFLFEKNLHFYSDMCKNKTKNFSDRKDTLFLIQWDRCLKVGPLSIPAGSFPLLLRQAPKSTSWDPCESVPWVRSGDHLQYR